MRFPQLRLLLLNETDPVQTLSRVLVEAFGTGSDPIEKRSWMRRARLLLSGALILNAAFSSAALAGSNRVLTPTPHTAPAASADAQRKMLTLSPLLRQDLFDRASPTNVRANWPAPPAQPGQF
jgi:hypothetical protein